MNILLIGYYELKEHLKHIKKKLIEYSYNVISYPLYQYAYDSNDKLDNYESHLLDFIDNNSIDIILWWFLDVPVKVFKHVKKTNPNIYYILFNSDDPNNISSIIEKSNIFNLIITPCKQCVSVYKESSKATVLWSPCGYDPKYYHYVEPDINYACDISIICYDLLIDPYFSNQTVNRKVLIDNIIKYCENNNKIFKVYGPYALKEIYPNNYADDVNYINMNKVFNNSKINIYTHTFNNYELAVSDTQIKILGCKALLFMDCTDPNKVLFIDNINCVYYDKDNYISKIHNILNNNEKYDIIRENGLTLASSYTWKKFVEKIHIEICRTYFDADYYKKVYSKPNIDLWNLWLTFNTEICYKLKIPATFDHIKYASDYNIDSLDKDIIYFHWFQNGKKKKYLVKSSNTAILNYKDISKNNNINAEQLYKLYDAFNITYSDIGKGLDLLQELYNYNPRIKINDILHTYIDMTF